MHALDVGDAAERLKLHEFAGQVEPAALTVGSTRSKSCRPARRVVDAHRHRPPVGPQHPLLNKCGLDMCAIDRLGRRREAPRHHDMRLAVGFESEFASSLVLSPRHAFGRPHAGRERHQACRSLRRAPCAASPATRRWMAIASGASRHGRFVPSTRRKISPASAEHLQVPRHRGLRHFERFGEFHHRRLAQR